MDTPGVIEIFFGNERKEGLVPGANVENRLLLFVKGLGLDERKGLSFEVYILIQRKTHSRQGFKREDETGKFE